MKIRTLFFRPIQRTKRTPPLHLIVIGIDFGETSCRVGISDEKYGVQIIPDEQGRNMVPSYVTFTRQGPPLVGFEALDQAVSNPKNTISGIR